MPANKRHPKVTFLDGTTCTAGPECRLHAGLKIAETPAQRKQAAVTRQKNKEELTQFKEELKVAQMKSKRRFFLDPKRSIESVLPNQVVSEFDVEKNGVTPSEVAAGSDHSYYWKCSEGHSYSARPSHRKEGAGCPFCSGKRTTQEDSLAGRYPEVAILLDEARSGFSASTVRPGSGKMGWWKCPNDIPEHAHDAYVYQKTGRDGKVKSTQCPYCSNHRLSSTNSLQAVHPELADEFDVEKNRITPDQVITGGNTPVWWKCKKEQHSWKATPAARIYVGTGCPKCSQWATSKTEIAFRSELAKNPVLEISEQTRLDIPFGKKSHMLVDIIGKVKSTGQLIAFEYDSKYYHAGEKREQIDLAKSLALIKAGYLVVRFRDSGLKNLNLPPQSSLQVSHNWNYNDKDVKRSVEAVSTWLTKDNIR